MRVSDGGGASIPPGDPGAIRGASSQLSGLASQISGIRSQSRGASSELVGRSWSSPAAGMFEQASSRYSNDLGSVEDAVTSAAGALLTYAAALEAAQQQARTAIAAQSQAQTTAEDAQNRLASKTPPAGASTQSLAAFQQQQTQASTAIEDTMTQAMSAAGARLGGAFAQATASAQVCAGALNAAAGRMAPLAHRGPSGKVASGVDASKGAWIETFAGWFEKTSHMNDFLGAAAVSFIHQYEVAAERAGQSALAVFEKLPEDEAGVIAVLSGAAQVDGLAQAGQDFDTALSAAGKVSNPLVRLLTSGLSSDEGSVLAKVPLLGLVFTAGAIGLDFSEGKSPAEAIGVPVANLAVGTGAAEGMGALLASDAVAPILASLEIPGVGEAVICGLAAVGVAYAVDQGATWVWDNRAAIGHTLESAVNEVVSVDQTELHYGELAWNKSSQALANASTWAVTHGEQELASLGNDAVSVGSTLLHTGGGALHTLESAGGTVVNDAEPWHWGL